MATASSEYFVVKPIAADPPGDLTAEPAGSTGLFVFRSPSPSAAPRNGWDRLMREYGDRLQFASPVMVDDRGRQMLPTGKIVVQFHAPPSGEALRQFEKTYGLRYLKTNEFKREQLSFEALEKATYPPDLIARLKSDSNIKLAAPETMARYSRV
jgi:hypothetical protein